MRALRNAFLASVAILAPACSEKQPVDPIPVEDPALVRSIAQGDLVGARSRENSQAWFGVPYAAPPVGALRWAAPRPPASWEGVFSAIEKGSRCVQAAGGHEEDGRVEQGAIIGSEDCLYLDIYAPGDASPGDRLPVMVWIHGGGNYMGSGADFNLGRLAETQQVIGVSINYRLGPLGWFAHGAIRDVAQTELDRTANFGTLDIVQSLSWVRENIAAFGGDPGNVTIFGESAGGINVASMLVSPQARGLYHKAVMQSGMFRSHGLQEAEFGPLDPRARKGDAAREGIAIIAERLRVEPDAMTSEAAAAWMRSLEAADIVATFKGMRPGNTLLDTAGNIDVTDDGIVIPLIGVEAALDDPDHLNPVPLIFGTNRDEILMMGFQHEEMIGSFFNLRFWKKNPDLYDAHGDFLNGIWKSLAVDEPAIRITQKGLTDVYAYRFDWDEQGAVLTTSITDLIGAGHGVEQGFVMGAFEDRINDPGGVYFNDRNREGRERLSAQMMSYWANFAYSGAPGRGRGGELAEWPAWSNEPSAPKLMVFDSEKGGGVRASAEMLRFQSVLRGLGADARLDSDEERCLVVEQALESYAFIYADLNPLAERFCAR